MKTITINHPVNDMLALFNHARTEDVIVYLHDGSTFMLAAIDPSEVEVLQMRKQTALMELLDRRAAEPATLSIAEVKSTFGLE